MTLQELAKKYKTNEFKAEPLAGKSPTVDVTLSFMRGPVKMRFQKQTTLDPDALDKVDKAIQTELAKKPTPKTPK